MNQLRTGLFQRILSFVLSIGADPEDSDYVRLIKRIYYVSAVFGCVAGLGSTVWYFLSGQSLMAWLFFFSFGLFIGTTVDGFLYPRHFRGIIFIVLIYFVAAPVFVTVLLGGIWRTEGILMIGLMGPLLGLVFFLKRRWAVALFLIYSGFVLGLALIEPRLEDSAAEHFKMNPFMFWLSFLVVAAFIFGVMYFFVVQRDKAHRLLAEEKAKSERLLRRIETDLEQAARIQKDLLPREGPRLEGYDISGLNIPCYEVGGDYYDFVPVDADRLGVVIADVSGKGISASLLMASLRAALLAEIHSGYDLGRMASRLNDFVFKSSDSSSFITFFFGELDRRTGEMRYINAGHNPPFVLRREGGTVALKSLGFALGMFPGATYEPGTVSCGPGDLAVLFTDGIPEGRNAQGRDYSEDRLQNLVRQYRGLSAAEICRKVIGDVHGFSSETQPCDDITLVVLKRVDETSIYNEG